MSRTPRKKRPATPRPASDVFSDLVGATIRGARNYHRLEHLGRVPGDTRRRATYTLHEETITDLLVAEMSGKAYSIDAPCPTCTDSTKQCAEWEGQTLSESSGFRVRSLTKAEEGGNEKTGRRGAQSDFVLVVENHDPGSTTGTSAVPQLRMLIQAKRLAPGDELLTDERSRTQYDELIKVADESGALPYYAFYVQQPDAHSTTQTACHVSTTAADLAIVLVAAHSDPDRRIPGRLAEPVLAGGRPLRCLGGCRCTDAPKTATAWTALQALIRQDYPTYAGTLSQTPLPPKKQRLIVNAGISKPGTAPRTPSTAPSLGGARSPLHDQVLVVRLGAAAESPDPGRRLIGYQPGMSTDDLREAARRYWRLNMERAQQIRYLVAASGRHALTAYEVIPDGLTFVRNSQGLSRASFDVTDIEDADLRTRLMTRTDAALADLPRGAINPVMYLPADRVH